MGNDKRGEQMIEAKNITNEPTEQITISWDGERVRLVKWMPGKMVSTMIFNPREASQIARFLEKIGKK